jgi:hypothetical protein
MKKYEIIFILNYQEKIIVQSPYPIHELVPCDEIPILFLYNKHHYVLNTDFIHEAMYKLRALLTKALANKLPLHKSIKKNIGYLWNEYLQDKPGFVYKTVDGFDYWVGQSNLLWNTPSTVKPETATWLYNDNNGSIILEITPTYPWHFVEPKEGEVKIPYEQWIMQYKPLIIRIIPREVAEQWLKQAQDLVAMLEKHNQSESSN